MSRSIELPEDVYARIEEAATNTGNSVAEVIASRFPARTPQPCTPAVGNGSEEPTANGASQPQRTLADEFVGLVGLIDSGRTDLSQRTGELFGKGMLKKRHEGRL